MTESRDKSLVSMRVQTFRSWRTQLAVSVILATEAGVVLSHVWAREDHTHFAHRPWVEGLDIANWFHVASALSHWPAVLLILWLAVPPGRRGRNWLALGACSAGIWWVVKALAGKGHWGMWWMQAAGWIGGG